MFLLIWWGSCYFFGCPLVSIHLMFLLISNTDKSAEIVLCVSIHLMFLLIYCPVSGQPGEVRFNTSHVSINLNKLRTAIKDGFCFNTSHVSINPINLTLVCLFCLCFNTSHVSINRKKTTALYGIGLSFNTSHVSINPQCRYWQGLCP